MTMENWNPYRRDDEYLNKHYGIKTQVQLIAGIIVFGCLLFGSIIALSVCLKELI